MSSKRLISDQVLIRLAGDYPSPSFQIDERDIWKSLEQKVNAKLGMRQFSLNLPNGETIPDNLMLGTYEDVAVTSFNTGSSKSILPAMPVSLPRNAGISEIRPVLNVVPTGDKILGNPMIPLLAGQDFLLQADSLLNNLMGLFAYTPNGMSVIYNSDLTKFEITKVDIKLVLFDISQYTVTETLPIPRDYESELIQELIQEFAPVPETSGLVNNFSNANQTTPK